jgi:hypothetical protein
VCFLAFIEVNLYASAQSSPSLLQRVAELGFVETSGLFHLQKCGNEAFIPRGLTLIVRGLTNKFI